MGGGWWPVGGGWWVVGGGWWVVGGEWWVVDLLDTSLVSVLFCLLPTFCIYNFCKLYFIFLFLFFWGDFFLCQTTNNKCHHTH